MFKNWSLKSQLQFWAVTTVTVVAVMALMTNYAYSLIESSRKVVSEKLLPVSNSSHRLSSVISAFSHRQQQILTSDNLLQLAQLRQRDTLEQQFEQNWLRLQPLFVDDPDEKQQFASLFSFYQDFLALDSDLYQRKKQALTLTQQIKQASDNVASLSARQQQQLNKLTNRLNQHQPVVQQLKLLVSELDALTFQSFLATSDQQLEPLSKRLDELAAVVKQNTDELEKALTEQPDLSTELNQSRREMQRLFSLVNDEDGLLALQKKQWLANALLAQTANSSMSVMSVLTEKIGRVARDVSDHTHDLVQANEHEADETRWRIIALSVLLTLLMMIFAWRLSRNIQSPLTAIRQSIHALSEGQFDTRMRLPEGNNELSLLARDFNRFAENTENTISQLHDARLSLQSRQQHLQAILNVVPEAILSLTEDGIIIDLNPSAELVFGAALKELSGISVLKLFSEIEAIDSMEVLAKRVSDNPEFTGRRLDGRMLSMSVSLSRINTAESDIWVCVISDVTAWKETDRRLQQLSVEQDAILENAIIGIAFVRERKFVRVNQRFEQLFGESREQLIGESTRFFYPNEQAYQQLGEQAYTALTTGDSYEAQLELVKADGSRFWCALSGKAIDPANPMEGAIWLFEDVTKQRENEEYLTRLASVDALTGLPNRNVFNDRVEHAIHRAHRTGGRLAVFFLDLDHFKTINDSLGHRAGDALLKDVASRIKSCLREGDTVARLGGDEFTLLLEDVRSAEYVGKVAEKVIDAMSKPYSIETTEVTISPSIGVSLYPADGRDGDMLIRNADAAMYHAKKLGRNNFQFYSVEMNAEAAERLVMESALRRAVENDELTLHYQAQFDLESGQVVGAEALLRWHNDDWGHVSPARFVPILEDTGLIGLVGERVLTQACETYLELKDALSPDFMIAVNLSGRQFKGGNLATDIRRLLKLSGMPARNLELEITESMLMEDTQLATLTLSELSEMGVSLAIDDFGTGYSSLSYLKQFPLNVLKIDSSFIRDLMTDKEDAAIVDAIMAMSESLGLTVVAEGVETEEQLQYLKQRHCQRAQGYFLSRPLDKAAFVDLVKQTISV